MLDINYLQEICRYFVENNINVLSFNEGKSDDFLDNNLTEITITINPIDIKKWRYLVKKVNFSKRVVEEYYDGDKTLRFVFVGNNEPYSDIILQEDARVMLEALQKKYYTVSPERESFSVLVKPTHRCNLDCKYCYDKLFRETIKEDMSMETLDSFVKLLSFYAEKVHFIWHGGEPTMVGIGWFEEAHKVVFSKYPMLEFDFQLMSNGINLNPQWFDFFRQQKMQVGISYNAYFQDKLRSDNEGEGRALEETLKYSKEIGMPLGTIDVITSMNYKKQIEIYEFYKEIGINTCMNHIFHTKETEKNNLELPAEDFSEEFLKYFKHWLFDKNGVVERSALEALGFVIGSAEAACKHQDCRYNWLGINPLGELYPCDRYYPEKYRIGKIKDFNSIKEIFDSAPYKTYCKEIQMRFDTECKECGYWFACKGGCNGAACEKTNSVSKTDEFDCKTFRFIFNGIYDILRSVNIYNDNLNPCAKKAMIENNFYSIGEIKGYLKDAGVNIYLEYDKENLLKCSEYEIFRGVNFPKDGSERPNFHTDFIYSNQKKHDKRNKETRKRDFFNFLKGVALNIDERSHF